MLNNGSYGYVVADVRAEWVEQNLYKSREKENRRGNGICKLCPEPTKQGKRYCLTHLDKIPYVADVLKNIEMVEAEIAEVKEIIKKHGLDSNHIIRNLKRVIKENSQIVQDIITFVGDSTFSAGYISKNMCIAYDVALAYVRVMVTWKMVKLKISSSKKHSDVVWVTVV